MNRRELLRALAAVALGNVTDRAHSQPAGPAPRRRIGFVSPTAPGARDEAFQRGLLELGYAKNRDVIVEERFADGRPERIPGLVEELVGLKVDVLVVGATIGARAAKRATTAIPIVFAGSSDPVAGGIVSNLARPGGNITGVSLAYGDGFAGKWLELLKEAAPHVTHFAVLWSSSNPAATRFVGELRSAAEKTKAGIEVHHAANATELDHALASIGAGSARGLIVAPSPFVASRVASVVQFSERHRTPAMFFEARFPEAGGLMSYGPDIADSYRRAAAYVDRILKGAKPGDLPVEQPTRFELVVNRRAAQALGLRLPQSILLRADRVIE